MPIKPTSLYRVAVDIFIPDTGRTEEDAQQYVMALLNQFADQFHSAQVWDVSPVTLVEQEQS